MLPLIVLGLGILCALVSRVLLLIAAIRISVGWALGVFLPFGPLFFRLKYAEEARSSMVFRYLTLPFLGFYLVQGSDSALASFSFHKKKPQTNFPQPGDMLYYGTERKSTSVAEPIANLPERRAANDNELIRLRNWYEALRLQKRDLLHSDADGNRLYAADLALYNDALAKATAERNLLDAAPK